MQRDQVFDYFDRLYDHGDLFEIVAIKDGKARRSRFATSDKDEVLEALAGFEKLGWNLYASVLPLQKQKAGVYDRVWLDRDDVDAEDILYADNHMVPGEWPQPNLMVETSREDSGIRWQRIWRLDTELPEDEARSLIKRIAKAGNGDTAVHDPRRVLRIPGLTNHKRGTPTILHEANSVGHRVSPDDFPVVARLTPETLSVEALMQAEINDPKHVLGEWLSGADEGERARKAYVTARFLKSCAVEFNDALAIVNTGAKRSTPPLSDQEVVHAVESAYGN